MALHERSAACLPHYLCVFDGVVGWCVSVCVCLCVCLCVCVGVLYSPKRNPEADPSAGPLLTLLQFVGVALLSGLGRIQWPKGQVLPSLAPRAIPLSQYGRLVGMFMVMSLLNNYAFALHISQPMHMVFRSASLVVSFAMGKFLFGKSYNGLQFVGVVIVSCGAFLATAAEALVGDTATAAEAAGCCDGAASAGSDGAARDLSDAMAGNVENAGSDYMFTWWLGILCLATTLVTSGAFMSVSVWVLVCVPLCVWTVATCL